MQVKVSFDNLVKKHPKLFCCGLGKIICVTAKIHVPDHVQPKFFKPRPLPYALKDKVEKELLRLQESGVIKPIQFYGSRQRHSRSRSCSCSRFMFTNPNGEESKGRSWS